ncbi:MAG: hypothetical protein KDC87_14015, partial [Planctomycetes bacterium]|nr:hypothetical protein [Planctomycetota bacterium]
SGQNLPFSVPATTLHVLATLLMNKYWLWESSLTTRAAADSPTTHAVGTSHRAGSSRRHPMPARQRTGELPHAAR